MSATRNTSQVDNTLQSHHSSQTTQFDMVGSARAFDDAFNPHLPETLPSCRQQNRGDDRNFHARRFDRLHLKGEWIRLSRQEVRHEVCDLRPAGGGGGGCPGGRFGRRPAVQLLPGQLSTQPLVLLPRSVFPAQLLAHAGSALARARRACRTRNRPPTWLTRRSRNRTGGTSCGSRNATTRASISGSTSSKRYWRASSRKADV